jgi:hypothetical protein
MSEQYERGLEHAFAAADGRAVNEDENVVKDVAMYRIAENRLGRWSHEWEAVADVEKDPSRLKVRECKAGRCDLLLKLLSMDSPNTSRQLSAASSCLSSSTKHSTWSRLFPPSRRSTPATSP